MSTQNIEKEQTSTRYTNVMFTVTILVFLVVMAGYFAWTLYGEPPEYEYLVTHCNVSDGGRIICTDEV